MKQLLLLFFLCLIGCKNPPGKKSLAYIGAISWEFESGFRAGNADFMHFGQYPEYWDLRHDTVFHKLKPVAIVIHFEPECDCLAIRSIVTGETGEYINMNHES